MIIVELKKIEDLEDFLELNLPAKIWNIQRLDSERIIKIYFDSDDENKVKDAMKIIKEYLKGFKEHKTKKIKKEDVIKNLGLE